MLLIDETGKVKRIVGLLLGSYNECLAIEVGCTNILQSSVKRDGRHTQHALGIGHDTVGKHIGGMSVKIVADAPVVQHNALGTAC